MHKLLLKMKYMIKYYLIGIILSLTFFVIGLMTLSDYGINTDESIHFIRGNAYLHILTTGEKKYSAKDFVSPRTSEWKDKSYNPEYFMNKDGGHPALNDILAAATNLLFHEKIGIMGDLESYHLFELFISSMLVFLVFAMTRKKYGIFAGTVAFLSIALYPLFYGESHFNIKDPIEATFYTFTLYFFYLGLEKINWRYFFISSLFCALAFGTKFNIVFLPFIIIPYLIIRYFPFFLQKGKLGKLKKIPKSIYLILFLYPFIVLGIHFLTRPFLWQDSLNRFMQIIQYYQEIGTGMNYQSRFLKYGWNTYPIIFVSISTPLVILFYFLVGIVIALSYIKKERDKFSLLLLIWLSVTLLRVSFPGSSIYGGVRQIMEYIPAMAVIAGIGALYLRNFMTRTLIKNNFLSSIIIFAGFIPLLLTLHKYHPYENIFMNSLVGGIKGATEKKIPGAGETMGNSYLEGILWLSKHAEKNARFHFPEGLGSNLTPQFLRKDIKFGAVFSGMARKGEYMMEMYSVEFPFPKYNADYLEKFLIPVYIKKIEGVPVLKIWKNDIAHTKPDFIKEEEINDISVNVKIEDGLIEIDIKKPAYITRIEIEHANNSCLTEGSGQVRYISERDEESLMPDDLYKSQGLYALSLQTNTRFVYFFTAQKAKKIIIAPEDDNLCLFQVKNVKVFRLRDLKI